MELKLFLSESHSCSYLEDKEATTAFVDPKEKLTIYEHSRLAELGFRRSGPYLYRPQCNDCEACIAVRVPVRHFIPTRSQRRNRDRFNNLHQSLLPVSRLSDQHYRLYHRYITERHQDGDMFPPEKKQFDDFLRKAGPDSFLIQLHERDKLVACAVTDRLDHGLSANYTFFDPDKAYSGLGVYCILSQIEQAITENREYLYLGYWIKDCQKMSYKLNYRPTEVFIQGQWTWLT